MCRGPKMLQNATTECRAETPPSIFHFWSMVAKLLVVGILLSAMACSEFPELANLTDDASNDFISMSYVAGEIASTVAVQAMLTADPSASDVMPYRNSSDSPQHRLIFRSSRNLLELYSVLRT